MTEADAAQAHDVAINDWRTAFMIRGKRGQTFWTYEGGTFGFRTVHLYLPESGLIIAIGLNSSTSEDHVMTLAGRVYDTLLAHRLIAAK